MKRYFIKEYMKYTHFFFQEKCDVEILSNLANIVWILKATDQLKFDLTTKITLNPLYFLLKFS